MNNSLLIKNLGEFFPLWSLDVIFAFTSSVLGRIDTTLLLDGSI